MPNNLVLETTFEGHVISVITGIEQRQNAIEVIHKRNFHTRSVAAALVAMVYFVATNVIALVLFTTPPTLTPIQQALLLAHGISWIVQGYILRGDLCEMLSLLRHYWMEYRYMRRA